VNKTTVARTFRDLKVYQLGRQTAGEIYQFTKLYALSDQIRRSSRAVKAMIAEAWGRRRYKAVFISQLDEALGEITETQSWLDDAADAGYLNPEQFTTLNSACISTARMPSRMIDRPGDFCKHLPATGYRSTDARVAEKTAADYASHGLEEFFA
jgi:four helix bundle protein